jgi:hypothetical protein
MQVIGRITHAWLPVGGKSFLLKLMSWIERCILSGDQADASFRSITEGRLLAHPSRDRGHRTGYNMSYFFDGTSQEVTRFFRDKY